MKKKFKRRRKRSTFKYPISQIDTATHYPDRKIKKESDEQRNRPEAAE